MNQYSLQALSDSDAEKHDLLRGERTERGAGRGGGAGQRGGDAGPHPLQAQTHHEHGVAARKARPGWASNRNQGFYTDTNTDTAEGVD